MKKYTYIFLFIFSFIIINNYIYAYHEKVLDSYKQVTNIGGINQNEDIIISKTIKESSLENYFDITLNVKTTNKIKEITTEPDIAIVIVMDISNTMKKNNVSSGKTRYEAAMDAGSQFIKKFISDSKDISTKREIGFVSFNTDSNLIFSLEDYTKKEENSSLTANQISNKLINTMKNKTSNIINDSNYDASRKRFTNIESGLLRAYNMLNNSKVNNKYIILITDGFPTTYLNKKTPSLYDGYEPFTDNATQSKEGVFANSILKKSCHGTNYSNLAAIRARELATIIKGNNIDIMVVGTGISNTKTINDYLQSDKERKLKYSTVDTDTINYEIESVKKPNEPNLNSYELWLKYKIGSNIYYDSDSTSITDEYMKIFNKIIEELLLETKPTWVVTDPMGTNNNTEYIEFVGFYDYNSKINDSLKKNNLEKNTASYNNIIKWDLKDSNYKRSYKSNNKTYYEYELIYKIRLKNELDSFNKDIIYNTNDDTILTYITLNNNIISSKKTIKFPSPEIVGYNSNLEFNKISSYNNYYLEGVKFKLIHDKNCLCHNEKKYPDIKDITYISNKEGIVNINNIPSGHSYILKEIETNNNHILLDKDISFKVEYGNIINPPDKNIVNKIKTSNIEIEKISNLDNDTYLYKFRLEIKYNNNLLSELFPYKINNTNGYINPNKDIISLKNNEKIIIYGLPVGSSYTISEIDNYGFDTSYTFNNIDYYNSNKYINNYLLEDNNYIKFINNTSYILPNTGSSSLLILNIVGYIFIIIPIIYIIYLIINRYIRKDRYDEKNI